MQSLFSHRLINRLSATGVRAKIWLASGARVGVTGILLAFGVSHKVHGQVALENEPLPQSEEMQKPPEYLQANADLQAQTREAVGPFEGSANDKRLIVKPALLVLPETVERKFEVRLSSEPSGDVTVAVSVPTRLAGKLIPSKASLTFTVSNFDQFQEVSVRANPGSDTGDKEEFLTLSASGGGYNSAEARVPIYVDQDVCANPGYPHWRSVREGSSCVTTYDCDGYYYYGRHLDLGDYIYISYENGSATPEVDLKVNGLDSLEITYVSTTRTYIRTDHPTDQLVAPADGIPEGDETLGIQCYIKSYPVRPEWSGLPILILDPDGWAVGDTAAAESSGEMTFLLKFPMPVAKDLTVKYQTKDGSATAGDDYDSRTDSVTVQKGGTSAEIRVPLIRDNIAEGVEEFKLVTWSDQFRGIGRQESIGRILEPGILLQENPLEVEEGSSATYQARLAVEPSGEVTVAISVHAGTGVRLLEPTSLSFMPSDFDTWKDVIVSADIDTNSNPDKVTLTHTASGASEYAGVTADLEVTILDRYAVELQVTPTLLVLKENGSNSEKEQDFTVRLGSPPVGGNVKVAISVADTLQNKVSLSDSGPLTFDTSSWDKAQTITVTAMDDSDAADESGRVDLTASGAGYSGQYGSVTVTISDDDTPALNISASTLNVDEGGSATYTVSLTTRPSAEVSVAITSDNTDVTLDRKALSFGVGDWNQPQRITVSAREDDDASPDYALLAHEASGGGYESVSGTVAVNVVENETPALNISASTLNVDEGGSATYCH